MKIFNIPIPIYFGTLQVVVTKDFREPESKLGFDFTVSQLHYSSYVSNTTSNKTGITRYTLLIKPDASPKIIAHEAFHVVSMVFNDRGIEYDTENDEPAAYLLGWVVEQIHLSIDRYVKKHG